MLTIHPEIKFIGVVDDNLDLFEGQYPLPKGISYNSYLINDEHIAVIDAVDRRRRTDWLENLREALSDRQPDYLIVQHVEPDHSACVVDALNRYPSMKVVASAKAIAMLGNFFEDFDFEERSIAVKEGDILDLGRAKLKFVMAPMVHWPEVMVTLDLTDGILFSADAFGTFATPWSTEPWDDEGRRYYCNIVGKYGNNVQTLMKKLTGAGFHTICPLHGPVLRDNLAPYWLASMLDAQGAGDVILMDLGRHDVSEALAEAFRLNRLALCSVTYDAGLFPAMHDFLHHLAAKNFRNRKVGIVENGSWAPISGKLMRDALSGMKDMEIIDPTVTLRSRLHSADIPALRQLAVSLAASR